MKQVLIIDDSSFMREVLKDLLTTNIRNIQVLEAENKLSALEQLKKIKPDLILLDTVIEENELEGFEILKEIKRIYAKANVIMLTSIGQTAVIEKCRKLGVLHYIQKPFDQDDVLKNVSKFLITEKTRQES